MTAMTLMLMVLPSGKERNCLMVGAIHFNDYISQNKLQEWSEYKSNNKSCLNPPSFSSLIYFVTILSDLNIQFCSSLNYAVYLPKYGFIPLAFPKFSQSWRNTIKSIYRGSKSLTRGNVVDDHLLYVWVSQPTQGFAIYIDLVPF